MKIVYVGPLGGPISVVAGPHEWTTDDTGTVDVPDHVADGCLAQPTNWQPVPTAAKTPKE